MYRVWERPTIGWSLECEGDRSRAYQVMKKVESNGLKVGRRYRGSIVAGLVMSLIAVVGACCCLGAFKDDPEVSFCLQSLLIFISSLVLFGPMLFFWNQSNQLTDKHESLLQFDDAHKHWINKCTDTHSWVNIEPVIDAARYHMKFQSALAVMALFAVSGPLIFLCLGISSCLCIEYKIKVRKCLREAGKEARGFARIYTVYN